MEDESLSLSRLTVTHPSPSAATASKTAMKSSCSETGLWRERRGSNRWEGVESHTGRAPTRVSLAFGSGRGGLGGAHHSSLSQTFSFSQSSSIGTMHASSVGSLS